MNGILPWADLTKGELYFLLGYHDAKHLVPYIESLIYLGPADEAEGRVHRFVYASDKSLNGEIEEEEVITFLDADPSCIGDLAGLIEALQGAQSRRK